MDYKKPDNHGLQVAELVVFLLLVELSKKRRGSCSWRQIKKFREDLGELSNSAEFWDYVAFSLAGKGIASVISVDINHAGYIVALTEAYKNLLKTNEQIALENVVSTLALDSVELASARSRVRPVVAKLTAKSA